MKWKVILLSVPAALTIFVNGENAMDSTNVPTSLEHYLSIVAQKVDCHFTLEAFRVQGEPSYLAARFGDAESDARRVTDIASLIKLLETKLKGYAIQRPKGSKIIHLIDKRLLKKKAYALEKKVSLEYAGTLGAGTARSNGVDGLVVALMAKVPGIAAGGTGYLYDTFDDHVTKVKVSAKRQPVRRILSDYIPLQTYGKMLWLAQTVETDRKLHTSVQFYGPQQKASVGNEGSTNSTGRITLPRAK